MPNPQTPVPAGSEPLENSEHPHAATTTQIGPAPASDQIKVTLIVRRRPDGQPLRGADYFQTTRPSARPQLSREAFAQNHGAHPAELALVEAFARAHGL